MPKYFSQANDPYIDPATGILRNILGIVDQADLDKAEATFASIRFYEMDERFAPIRGQFDLDHLCAVHRMLFGDVYPWAGELRQVDITKGETQFAFASAIESAGHQVFGDLKREGYLRSLDADAFSRRAGYYLGEINVLHPFREGNGRAQRAFFNQLAHAVGFHVQWPHVTREAMTHASIAAYDGDSGPMADLIRHNLVDRDRERANEIAHAAGGEYVQIERAETGKSYAGRVIGATERYIVQERTDAPGSMVLHHRYRVHSDVDKMRGQVIEIRYPHGAIGRVRAARSSRQAGGPGKPKRRGPGR